MIDKVRIWSQDMFADIEISEAKETTLGGNVWLNDKHRMSWQIDHNVLFSLSKLFEDIPRHGKRFLFICIN